MSDKDNETSTEKREPIIQRFPGGRIPQDIQILLQQSTIRKLSDAEMHRVKKYIDSRVGDESLQARALRFIDQYALSGSGQAVACGSDVHQPIPAMEEGNRIVPLSISEYQLAVCDFLKEKTHDSSLVKGKKRWRVHSSDKPFTITQLDYPLLKEGFTEFASHIVIANGGEMHTDWQPDYEGILGSFRRTYHGDHGWKEMFLRPSEEDLYNNFGLRCISYTKGNRIDLKFTYPDQSQLL